MPLSATCRLVLQCETAGFDLTLRFESLTDNNVRKERAAEEKRIVYLHFYSCLQRKTLHILRGVVERENDRLC